jgi:hypothetical protein
MPDKTATQDKFNGTCDLIISLTTEETRGWRTMTPKQRQSLVKKWGEMLTGKSASKIADLVQPFGRDEASRAAADNAAPKFTKQALRVYHAIKNAGEIGLTDEEGQEIMVMSGNSYRPARVALSKGNIVARSGQFRPTRSGNKANVWITIADPPDLAEFE